MASIIDDNNSIEGLDKVGEIKDRIKRAKNLQLLNKDETLRLRQKHIGPSVALFFQDNPLKIVQGRGQYLYDECGNDYLDCINNVAHVGHANPRVTEAISRQLSLLNTNSRFLHDNLSLYAKRLTSYFPSSLSVCYLVNSGSEANDLAIRLARAYTGNKDIVSVDGAYHGNLTSTMAISPYKNINVNNFEPESWAHVAPLPCSYRGIFSRDTMKDCPDETIGRLYAEATIQVIEKVKAQGRGIAAFIVESMISCGGQFPLPSGYLRVLQRYLRKESIVLINDEVQTGFGRSGEKMWAFQLDGDDILPDIVTIGKPMGNGFPVSAVVTTREIASAFKNIGTEYFNTFGGNPVSCSAALAVLDEIEDKKLMEHAKKVGSYILKEALALKANSSIVGDVRGHGFFLGIEIVENLKTHLPSQEYAQLIVQRFRDERILMSTEGKFGNVLKFKPPMVFNMDDAKRLVDVLGKALTEVENLLNNGTSVYGANLKRQAPRSKSRTSACSTSSSMSSSSWLESSCDDE